MTDVVISISTQSTSMCLSPSFNESTNEKITVTWWAKVGIVEMSDELFVHMRPVGIEHYDRLVETSGRGQEEVGHDVAQVRECARQSAK